MEHENLVAEHFQEVNSKLKELEHEAQEAKIPSGVSGKCHGKPCGDPGRILDIAIFTCMYL